MVSQVPVLPVQRQVQVSPPLKILVLIPRGYDHSEAGGSEFYIRELAVRWQQLGHDITLLCAAEHHVTPENWENGLHVIRTGSYLSVHWKAAWYYLHHLRAEHYDVVLDVLNGLAFFTPLYVRGASRITLLTHIHADLFRHELAQPWRGAIGVLERKLTPALYRGQTIVTLSESARRVVLDCGYQADNVHIIPPGLTTSGVPLNKAALGKALFPRLIYVGRLRHYKCVDVLIQAVSLLVPYFPDVGLDIVGKGDAEAELQALVQRLGLQDRVHFHGFTSLPVKEQLLYTAHLLVQPSVSEGWGMTVIEGNALGLPVVAANVPGLQDSVRHKETGLLFRPYDASDLANAAHAILADPDLYTRLSEAAVSWSQRFTWEQAARDWLTLIGACRSTRGVLPGVGESM